MHAQDQAIEDFQALQPHLFTRLVRLDLRKHDTFDTDEPETLLQLWLHADDVQHTKKLFLHLSCYGVVRENHFDMLWPQRYMRVFLRMKAIRQYYLEDLFFELSYLDEGYDDYNSMLAWRHFEAQVVDTCEERRPRRVYVCKNSGCAKQ